MNIATMYVFIALMCQPGLFFGCTRTTEVKIERLTKESCEQLKAKYERDALTRVASCAEYVPPKWERS